MAVGTPRVLVVDDVASHARVTAIGLRIEGFDVEVAADSEGALRTLAEQADQPFDVAMVDLMMPGTNGMQLCRLIRERHPDTRVVLTSTYHLSERQLLRADCGAVGFVPKPFDLSDLARFLRTKLRPTEASGVSSAPAPLGEPLGEGGGPTGERGAAA
ncbi:MAG: response regulator transcription factor [Polyangiaceae bacterium]